MAIESRKTEIRYTTSDPAKMLNKYITKSIYRKWTETFIDEGTNETVDIERNELLFDSGTLITQDVLVKIRFYMQEGSITEVEVSNQNRQAFPDYRGKMFPYLAQTDISGKKYKILLHAESVDNALEIIRDYIELNYTGMFRVLMVKEYESCVILTDELKRKKYDFERAYCAGEIDTETFLEELSNSVIEEQKEEEVKRNWYKINAKITHHRKDGEDTESNYLFMVQATTAERAELLINIYLQRREKELADNDENHEKREVVASIEESAIVSIGIFIPKAFSDVYKSE